MSDEQIAAEPVRAETRTRTNLLIGGVAFLGGIALTAGTLALTGGLGPQPAPTPTTTTGTNPAISQTQPALPPGTDIATLNAREAELAGKLDQLDTRIRDVDGSARGAAGYATRAERLMIASAVRRSIERGQPLGPLAGPLRARFGEDQGDAVATIQRVAAEPVTLEDLRVALDTIAPRLIAGSSDGVWNRVRRMLGDLVVLRQADAPSPRPADRLRRARRMLDKGQVEAALAEVAHMPGFSDAGNWASAARRYADAQRALAQIEQAAVQTAATPQTGLVAQAATN